MAVTSYFMCCGLFSDIDIPEDSLTCSSIADEHDKSHRTFDLLLQIIPFLQNLGSKYLTLVNPLIFSLNAYSGVLTKPQFVDDLRQGGA